MVNIELSSFLNLKGDAFVVDAFEEIMIVIVHCSYSMEPFFCNRKGEFVVVIGVYGVWITGIETSK